MISGRRLEQGGFCARPSALSVALAAECSAADACALLLPISHQDGRHRRRHSVMVWYVGAQNVALLRHSTDTHALAAKAKAARSVGMLGSRTHPSHRVWSCMLVPCVLVPSCSS